MFPAPLRAREVAVGRRLLGAGNQPGPRRRSYKNGGTSMKIRRTVAGVAALGVGISLAAVTIGAGTASADGGTSARVVESSPVDCRQDGWRFLRRAEDGTQFASLPECVRHAARGGGLTRPTVNLSYVRTDFTFMGRLLCRARVDVSGFAPNTQYAVVVAAADGSAPPVPVEFILTTDASGAAFGESSDLSLSQVELTQATVDGVLSSSVAVLCF